MTPDEKMMTAMLNDGRVYQYPLGTTTPLGFILESFAPICAGAPETHDEKLFVSAWNRAVGRINDLTARLDRLERENERLRYQRPRGTK